MEQKKRVNFTPNEKQRLLCVVGKYKNIVENKCTKATAIHDKVHVWTQITDDFNCSSETGPRSVKQLKALYENLKRSTRKSVAEKHHENYMAKIKEAKQVASNDKKEIMKTGGGSYDPGLNDEQALLLAEIMAQVTPLSNDSAAIYFDEKMNVVEIASMSEVVEPVASTSNANPKTHIPIPNPVMKKRKRLTTDEIRRQFYIKKLKIANFEL